MLCARLLGRQSPAPAPAPRRHGLTAGWLRTALERAGNAVVRGYTSALDWALAWPWLVVAVLLVVIGLNGYLFMAITKGACPDQDNGQLIAGIRGDQSMSSNALADKLQQAMSMVQADPAIETVVGFSGSGSAGGGFMAAALKAPNQRPGVKTRDVVNRLRPKLSTITGMRIFLNPVQELRMSSRSSNSSYQYTLKSDNQADLNQWTLKLAEAMRRDSRLTEIDEDQSDNGVETYVQVERDKAAGLGVPMTAVDAALYNAFGQRQIATMYSDLNQYAVVMEWQPRYQQSPLALADVYVPVRAGAGTSANPALRSASTGQPISGAAATMVPLAAFAHFAERSVPSSMAHDGGELSSTLSFDLNDGFSLQQGRQAVLEAVDAIGMPNNVRGEFSGAAGDAQKQESQWGLMILAALVVIYLVLGMLYESLIHPLTVLTTLPSAGFGAVFTLLALRMEFSIMALIGVFLLIGIVKKNAILIIDFALDAERAHGLSAVQAVRQACLLRFRPIMMTTLAAMLGALPLAIGFGQGSELRVPLGVTIIGGLIASQALTLLTTPVIYVLLDKLRRRPADETLLARGAMS
jgi:multidrug efflux pump